MSFVNEMELLAPWSCEVWHTDREGRPQKEIISFLHLSSFQFLFKINFGKTKYNR